MQRTSSSLNIAETSHMQLIRSRMAIAATGAAAHTSRRICRAAAHTRSSFSMARPRCMSLHSSANRSSVIAAAVDTDSDAPATAADRNSIDQQQHQQQQSPNSTSSSSSKQQHQQQHCKDQYDNHHSDEAESDNEEFEEAEDESSSSSEDDVLEQLKALRPSPERQAELAAMLSQAASESVVEDLGGTMLKAGLRGCLALALGYLLHLDVIGTFRWHAPDLQQGLYWSLPAAAMAAVITALPLPAQQQQQQSLAAAAAPAGGSSSSTGVVASEAAEGVYSNLARMARINMLAQSLPLEIAIPLNGDDGLEESNPAAAKGLMTDLSPAAALRALTALQQVSTTPWMIDLATPTARVVGVVNEQLSRLSSEVLWRGLVATELAAVISSSWATAGTSQDSPFFYARLFGLLTPQTSLAAAAAVLLLGRLPYLLLKNRPLSLYTRLSALDVVMVGQLTEQEWMVKITPVAAAAARGGSSSGAKKGAAFGKPKQQQQQQEQQGSSSAKDDGSKGLLEQLTSSSSGGGVPEVPVISQQQLGQFEQLLVSVALFCTGSSSSRHATVTLQEEQQGAELAAQLLETVKVSAAAKAAAAAAAAKANKARVPKAGLPAVKIANALKLVMSKLNSSRQQHYFIIKLAGDDDDDDSDSNESSDSESDHEADFTKQASPAAKAAAARVAAAVKAASSSQTTSEDVQEMLSKALKEVPVKDLINMKQEDRLTILGTMLKEAMQANSHDRAIAQGWRAAAAIPTAEDRIASYLIGVFAVLTELAPAGAFVATGGNVAASFVASSCYNMLSVLVNDLASRRARERVQQGLGKDWLLKLLPLQGRL